jgi:surfactin synthase thioesterase subunit
MPQTAHRAILGLVLLLCGCADSSNNIQWIRTNSNLPRLGNAYLVFGWQGISKSAIEELAAKVSKSGVQTQLIAESQWHDLAKHMREAFQSETAHEPIVLIGYSYGADNSLRVANELKKDDIAIALLVTIDPVTPPKVAPNIKRCINYYQSNGGWDILPMFLGVPLHKESDSSPTELSNWNLRTDRKDLLEPGIDHFSIPKDARVQDEIVALVLDACPPRVQATTQGLPP